MVIINKGRLVENGTPQELAAKVGEKQFFEVSAASGPEALSGALACVEGVESLASIGHGDGVAQARFESALAAEKIGPAVAHSLGERGLPLVAFTPRRASLEDVFRAATREEGN